MEEDDPDPETLITDIPATTAATKTAEPESYDSLLEVQALFDNPDSTGDVISDTESAGDRHWLYPFARACAWLFFLLAAIIFLGYFSRKIARRTPLLAGQRFGTVLGKIYLNPRASLHYVQTGGRILLVGVTQNHMALLTEFDEQAFPDLQEMTDVPLQQSQKGKDFLTHLEDNEAAQRTATLATEDADLASLRSELQRMQQSMQKGGREQE
jgi:flagellar biogenesis protein FliO